MQSESGWSNDKPWRFSLDPSVFPSTSDTEGSWVWFPLWTWDDMGTSSLGHGQGMAASHPLTVAAVAYPAMPPTPFLDFHSRYVAVDVLDMSRQMNWAREPSLDLEQLSSYVAGSTSDKFVILVAFSRMITRRLSFSRWVPSRECRVVLISVFKLS